MPLSVVIALAFLEMATRQAQQTTPVPPRPASPVQNSPGSGFPTTGPPGRPDAARAYENVMEIALNGQLVLEGGKALPEPVPVEYLCPE